MKSVFVVGAQKAGSTYLYNVISRSGKFSTSHIKEPHYFSSNAYEDDYRTIFTQNDSSMITLDASVSYLHDTGTAARIENKINKNQSVFLLVKRDPVDRAVSAYLHSVKHGRELRSFNDVFGSSCSNIEDIKREEDERIKFALSKGRVLFRSKRKSSFDDSKYLDPLWNFRYISNSFQEYQFDCYRKIFPRCYVIKFEELISDFIFATAEVSNELGFQLEKPNDNIDRNATRFSKNGAIRQVIKNSSPYSLKSYFSMAYSILDFPSVDGSKIKSEILESGLPWLELAYKDYRS